MPSGLHVIPKTRRSTGTSASTTIRSPLVLRRARCVPAGRDRRARPETQKEPAHLLRSTPYFVIIPSQGTAPQGHQLTPWGRGEGTAALYSAGSMRIILHCSAQLVPPLMPIREVGVHERREDAPVVGLCTAGQRSGVERRVAAPIKPHSGNPGWEVP